MNACENPASLAPRVSELRTGKGTAESYLSQSVRTNPTAVGYVTNSHGCDHLTDDFSSLQVVSLIQETFEIGKYTSVRG